MTKTKSLWQLTDDEADRLNPPPVDLAADDDGNVYRQILPGDHWLDVGHIPTPRGRLAWMLYHLAHGLAMGYPLLKVVVYAMCNTKPEAIDGVAQTENG